MLFAVAVLAALPDLVPARWTSNDPATLDLVRMTPVNCLLIEENQWSAPFNAEAAKFGISTFAVVRPGDDALRSARRALDLQFAGGVLEGAFDAASRSALQRAFEEAKRPVIGLTLRSAMRLDGAAPVIGTFQGLWPGIQVEEGGQAKAAPSGSPWIDTNTGFLRFVRASTKAAIWMANTPPAGRVYPVERYLQAVGDAALGGARWVLAFDAQFNEKLLARDARTVQNWRRIGKLIEYYETNEEWRAAEPFARLALVEDAATGALLSGGILDMIAVKHTPVRPIPPRLLGQAVLAPVRMAVNVDPSALNDEQRDVLRAFTRAGGTLLTGPPGWKFPQPRPDQITLEKDDLKKLDDIWRELNSMTGRKNLGARLFNVSSMLSNIVEVPARNQVVLNLVNYSDFAVENVTVHVLGAYKSAVLMRPDGKTVPLEGYPVDEGSGFDIDRVDTAATLVLTR